MRSFTTLPAVPIPLLKLNITLARGDAYKLIERAIRHDVIFKNGNRLKLIANLYVLSNKL